MAFSWIYGLETVSMFAMHSNESSGLQRSHKKRNNAQGPADNDDGDDDAFSKMLQAAVNRQETAPAQYGRALRSHCPRTSVSVSASASASLCLLWCCLVTTY